MQRRRCQLSPKLRRKKRIFFLSISFYTISFVSIIFFGVGLILNSSYFSIKNINVLGPNDEQTSKIKDIVSNEMSKNTLGLFYKDNFLLISKNKIVDSIEASFPEFKEVSLSLASLSGIDINIQKRHFFANWCDQDFLVCYPIDDAGFSYSDDNLKISSSTLRVVIADYQPEVGRSVAEEISVDTLKKYVEIFSNYNNITKVFVNNGEYFITLHNGVLIKVNFSNNPEEILNNLNSIKAENKSEDLGNIDYIDFRYGKKIFLKRK